MPILGEAEKLLSAVAGVALVKSTEEAREFMTKCAHVKAPLGLVCLQKVDEGTPMLVQMKDTKGHLQVKRAYVVNLGTSQTRVKYQLSCKRVHVVSSSVVFHLCCTKDEMSTKEWEENVSRYPLAFARAWMQKNTRRWIRWTYTTQ